MPITDNSYKQEVKAYLGLLSTHQEVTTQEIKTIDDQISNLKKQRIALIKKQKSEQSYYRKVSSNYEKI